MYSSIIHSTLENSGENAANMVWTGAELLTHYGSPFIIYGGYKALSSGFSLIRWAFSPPAPPAPPVVPAAAEESGWIKWGFKSARELAWWGGRKALAITGLSGLSHFVHQHYLSQGLWQNYKGIGVAFLRPLMEKLIPYLSYVFDHGNVNFHFRDLVPEGAATKEEQNFVFKGLHAIRGTLACIFGNCDSAFEERAYTLGKNTADTLEALGILIKDIIVGSTQVGPCLRDAPHTNFQCLRDGANYFSERLRGIYEMAAPVREALNEGKDAMVDWCRLGGNALIDYTKAGATWALGYGNQALWNMAASVEEDLGVPAAVTYGLEVGAIAAVGLFTAYKIGQFACNWAIPEAARELVGRLWRRPAEHDLNIHAEVVGAGGHHPGV